MRSEIILLIAGMAAVTYFTRVSCVALFKYTGMPVGLLRWLKHIPTAMLTALILPALMLPKGYLDLTLHNHYLLAGIVAAIAAYFSRNILVTLTFGMGTMFAIRMLSG